MTRKIYTNENNFKDLMQKKDTSLIPKIDNTSSKSTEQSYESNIIKKNKFLKDHIFTGLENKNNGFDIASKKYFVESEFEIALQRYYAHDVKINGIEPRTYTGDYYDYKTSCEYGNIKGWYQIVFKEFKDRQEDNLLYTASYIVNHCGYVPE
jgi:hypothetical protein